MALFSHVSSYKLEMVPGALIRVVSPCQECFGKSVMTHVQGGQSRCVSEVQGIRARMGVGVQQ